MNRGQGAGDQNCVSALTKAHRSIHAKLQQQQQGQQTACQAQQQALSATHPNAAPHNLSFEAADSRVKAKLQPLKAHAPFRGLHSPSNSDHSGLTPGRGQQIGAGFAKDLQAGAKPIRAIHQCSNRASAAHEDTSAANDACSRKCLQIMLVSQCIVEAGCRDLCLSRMHGILELCVCIRM